MPRESRRAAKCLRAAGAYQLNVANARHQRDCAEDEEGRGTSLVITRAGRDALGIEDGENDSSGEAATPKNESGKKRTEKVAASKPIEEKPKRSTEKEKVAEPSNRQIKNKSSTSARMEYRT